MIIFVDGEESSTVCGVAGEQGEPGESANVEAVHVASHAECEEGGVVITVTVGDGTPSQTVVCDGVDGDPGESPEVTVTIIEPAADGPCGMAGGQLITVVDADGTSHESEVCNGSDGDAPAISVVEDPAECGHQGGFSLHVDGAMVATICNGEDAPEVALVELAPDPAGPCIQGGVEIQITSVDEAGDAVMESLVICGNAAPFYPETGEICEMPISLSLGSTTVAGDFTGSSSAFSCGNFPVNVVWFEFSPDTTDEYEITATNAGEGTWSRLAIREGLSCDPVGTSVACVTSGNEDPLQTVVELEEGTSYLIAFYADLASFPMTDPEIEIQPYVAPPAGPGDVCEMPVELFEGLTGLTGTYTGSSSAFVCGNEPVNTVWFEFTPSQTAEYEINAVNNSTTLAWSRVAIREGLTCDPVGDEVACFSPNTKNVTGVVELESGVSYLIAFYTDEIQYTMVDPQIEIEVFVPPEPPEPPEPLAGDVCEDAVELADGVLVELEGEYMLPPPMMVTCDPGAVNSVWFSFVAADTGAHLIEAINGNVSEIFAWGRVVVLQGRTCSDADMEVDCFAVSEPNVTAETDLVAGEEYTIGFFTDGEIYPMVDPSMTISFVE